LKIIIVGGGEVGMHLGRILSKENHDIIIVDKDPRVIARVNEQLDVLALEGSGTSPVVMKRAKAGDADIVIAVTTVDEVNLITCILAHRMGAKRTVARISNPEYAEPESLLSPEVFHVDYVLNPELVAAQEVVRLIKRSEATDVLEFANGKVQLLGIRLDAASPIINRKLKDLVKDHLHVTFRAVAISRGFRTIVPSGNDTFKRGDQVFVMAHTDHIPEMLRLAGKQDKSFDNIMVLGGGKIGRYVTSMLQKDVHVKLIEVNHDKSLRLADEYPDALVIEGDGTDIDLLATEGIMDMDAFISVTNDEETNIISCLMAKHLGVTKSIALVDKLDYIPLAGTIGLDVAINKKLSAANLILKFVRKGQIVSIATLHGVDAEVIEIMVQKNSPVTRKKLSDLHFPDGALIGCISRNGEVSIPTGDTIVQENDIVVVFSLPQTIKEVERFFGAR
jgi:trk system potassium uptake protein